MDPFDSLRKDAAELHARVVGKGADPYRPETVVHAAIGHLQLALVWLEPGDPALKGARALHDDQLRLLCCANDLGDADRVITLAHEVGHVRLHAKSSLCRSDDIDASRSMEAAPVGIERVEDYGAHERRELQANVYGRELLMPRAFARHLHVERGFGATEISEQLGLPLALVRQQVLDAVLLPDVQQSPAPPATISASHDPSQDSAAAHRGSAFLLQAGPGTGKTRTLVKRLEGLLAEHVDPASVLVLTFSNRAAGELAERIATSAPEAAPRIWIGTFHAFGLDVIRRYHTVLTLPADPALFDRSDAIEVLEEILPTLGLVHYRNLWDPTLVLKDVISAISRAKDELVDPEQYRVLAERMRAAADDDEKVVAAVKAGEVAKVYELYEQALRDRKAVDFGDLVMLPARLLESRPDLCVQVQLRHRHILVDEYQDVNHASARLLRAVAGDGRRLWAVGDARQSIYRFRGASSANLPRFLKEYPEAQTAALSRNYRSHREIIDLVEGFSRDMNASAGMLPLAMDSDRGASGQRPQIRQYGYREDEISGVAASIRGLERDGVPLRAQAVLCRTNSRLNEIAAGLEARGIPVLHLGSLFERREIRDCLAVLSLAIDPYATGLVRVATLPRYRMSLNDVQVACRASRNQSGPALEALADIAAAPGFSAEGAATLRLLAEDLKGLGVDHSPWDFLSTWLLDRTRRVAELGTEETIAGRMKGVALWQFLNFARATGPPLRGAPIYRLLSRVRQLVLLAEERDLRQVPTSALHLDAVRLMTIHGSKGLEFEAVHVPGLVTAGLPSSYKGNRCPPPHGMVAGAEGNETLKETHAREEECLFFVAMSRARSRLSLTRYTSQDDDSKRGPSSYLPRVTPFADEDGAPAALPPPADALRPQAILVRWPSSWHPTDEDLRSYDGCPRRFFYTRVLKLGTARKPTAFSLTHDCLHDVIRWLSGSTTSKEPTVDDALAEFERIWVARGPCEHAFAADYHQLATRLVGALVRLRAGRRVRDAAPLALDLPNGRVLITPNEIAELPDGAVVVRRLHTGYKRSDEYDHIEYALYTLAGTATYGSSCRIEAVHLTDEMADQIVITDKKLATRKAKANSIVAALRLGDFAADPDPVRCPRCPHFFICDAAPHGSLTPLP